MAAKTKSLDLPQRQAFSRFLRNIIEERYEGNQTRAEKALGVTQGHLSAMLDGKKVGIASLLRIRVVTGASLDEMLGFANSPTDEMMQRLVSSVTLEVERMRKDMRELREQNAELMKQLAAKDPPAEGRKQAARK